MADPSRTTTASRGRLIAFEGIDGTGKSTQIRQLAEVLRRTGHRVLLTREPTDGPYGRQIRELFVQRHAISREEELALFMADRRQHVAEMILPALARGEIVLTDRYYFSTAAYQGAAGLDPERILLENEAFAPVPDLVILLSAPPAIGIHRIRSLRQEALNDFEQEEGLLAVAAVFDRLRRDCICRIDATAGIAQVHHAIMREVERVLGETRCGDGCDQVS